jgi:hypothetical protein
MGLVRDARGVWRTPEGLAAANRKAARMTALGPGRDVPAS